MPVGHSAEFKLSITRAMAEQLLTTLSPLVQAPLNAINLADTAERPGVYELHFRDHAEARRLYVGKAAKSLRGRLEQHHRKLSGRVGIELDNIRFICAYVDEDLDAAAPEKMLIKRYRDAGGAPWNTNGFGNRDPGRNRDNTLVKANHFDALFPINLDHEIEVAAGTAPASETLEAIKAAAPYNLRYDRPNRHPHPVLAATPLTLAPGPVAMRNLLPSIIAQLPDGWQATAFPGYVILYLEPEGKIYGSATAWWRKASGGAVVETPGPNRRAAAKGAIPEDAPMDDGEDEDA